VVPRKPPFLRGLTFGGVEQAPWLVPTWGLDSCGTAPDFHRTSLRLHRPGEYEPGNKETTAAGE
jgi:hypothetical protein